MKNRAKCKLCKSVIESHFMGDVVTCKCGEITVYDGVAMRCEFNNIDNFLRVDENGHEITVSYINKDVEGHENPSPDAPKEKFTSGELIEALYDQIKRDLEAPDHEKYSFVTNIALCHYLLAIVNILKRA